MNDMVGVVGAPSPPSGPTPTGGVRRDGLATAALVLGIAGFFPIPGLAASVVAVILGSLSGRSDGAGGRHRSGAAIAGIVLGCVSIGIFIVICVIYFGVLGYPLPQIHRYRPPALTDCPYGDAGCSSGQ